ncbi:MAG: polysaccharide biosynthesis tyrosine autokinase [Brumimicrobium sp.]|nr:polysaccharide biosynthesis tyrosine autokinase [Brumimicrobium sp.]
MEKNSNRIFVNTNFDLDILKIVFKRTWYWIILIAVLVLSAAFLYLRYTKPVYESKMLIQISREDQGADVLDFKSLDEEGSISREIELLRSELLFEKALSQLDLQVSHFAQGDVLTEKRYKQSTFNVTEILVKDSSLFNKSVYVYPKGSLVEVKVNHNNKTHSWEIAPGKRLVNPFFEVVIEVREWGHFVKDSETNVLYFQMNDIHSLTEKYLGGLEIKPVDVQAKTIEISYKSHNPELARDITRSVGNTFFVYEENFQKESAENVLKFISLQLDSLRSELNASKDSIMSFQREKNLPDPDNLSSSISDRLEKFKLELNELEEELRTLDMIADKLKENPGSLEVYKLIPELIGKSYEGSLNTEVKELHELIETKEDLLYKVTDENSMIKKLNFKIKNRTENINRIIEALRKRITEKIKVTLGEINALEEQYFQLPEKVMELSRLKNIQNLNEKYYTLLTEKQVLYSISNAGYASRNKVLNKASLSTTPISPKRNLIYGAALFFAFSLGMLLLFLRYVTFNEINQLPEIQKLLPPKVGVLGTIPLAKKRMDHSQLLVAEEPKSMISESFRTVRTNLSFVKNNIKTIAITSSISGEGKTFVALNLGGILAMSGKRIVIVDLDMRKPKIHYGFDGVNDQGMSNLLIGQTTVDQVVKKSGLKNLHYITAGPIPPNPSELILGEDFKKVVEELKNSYDMVLIDNPPIGLVSDGVNVLAMADVPIYVFKANYSKRFFVNKLKDIAGLSEIRNLNIILNGVKATKKNYGYGYGGYYEEKDKRSFFKRK